MIKRFYLLATMATVLLLTGCSEEVTSTLHGLENKHRKRTISLTTAMPGERAQTRIALEQDGKSIALTWEEGDEIQLSFIQGNTKIKQTVEIRNISGDGKTAAFDIVIPSEIEGTFTLYGVYGGGGIDDDNPVLVKLSSNTGNAQSLEQVQERDDVMLYFSEELDTEGDLNANVTFEHLGSLFSITIKHVGTKPLENLAKARLISTTDFGAGGGTFNMEEGTFSDPTNDYISFTAPENTLTSGDSITFWGWYPPQGNNEVWPELQLQLLDNNETVLAETSVGKERATPTETGKTYYFYALWDNDAGTNGNLQFTDSTYDGVFILTVGGQFFSTGLMKYYPNFITDATLPNYADWLNVYALISLKDMKTYSMDYFVDDIANTANIDIRLSVSTIDSRTVLRNHGTFGNQYSATDGTRLDQMNPSKYIANNTTFRRITDAGFDFINASAATIGSPTLAYYQSPSTSTPDTYVENGIIIGFRTAATSTVGERLGVMKEIKRIQLPPITGYGGQPNTYKLVVYAIRLL